jgi:ABC-type transport system involved in multi-copper enzyme maturation permease subunit
MNTPRVLYHLALADIFERTRRYSFLLILAAVIYLGILVNNGALAIDLGPVKTSQPPVRYSGELNSAWIGTMTVMVINTFLGLLGFYLVGGCIKRDIHTGVGQIIATTPIRRATYLVGKWISNFAVLSALVLIMAAAAVIMVLLKQKAALDPGALLMPFLAVALPNMALTAALAVVFETVPWLRGAVGNVIYFFLWMFASIGGALAGAGISILNDPIGQTIFSASIHASAVAAFPTESIGTHLSVGYYNLAGTQYRVFNWPGVDWTPGIVGGQWGWVVISLVLVLLSAVWFARFDPAREGLLHLRRKTEEAVEGEPASSRIRLPHITLTSLSPLVSTLAVNTFLGVLFAELRLLLNGRRWWWWLVIAGLNLAVLSNLPAEVKPFLLPFAWLWPLPIWSEMGNRERKNNTSQMVFSSARPVLRQLPAAWLAGVLATALFSIAWAGVFLSNGDLPALAGWVGAVAFIPTLALALGVFSSGNRVFEVVYLIWWYIGPFQKTPGLDFTAGAPQFYLLAAAALLLVSAYWRGRQVRV